MNTKTPLILLAVSAAFGVSACGSSKSDTLSKADLTKKAEAICKDHNAQSDKVQVPADINDATKAAPYFQKLAAIGKDQDDALKALKPADSFKADWDAYLAEEKKALDLVDGLAAAATAKDATKGQQLIAQIQSEDAAFKAAASKAGVAGCAS